MKLPRASNILITRPKVFCQEFAAKITRSGFNPVVFPMIETIPVDLSEENAHTIDTLSQFDWIIFSSRNAVRFFFEYISNHEVCISSELKMACIGQITHEELQNLGYEADFVPETFSTQGFLNEFSDSASKVLIPSSEIAPDVMADQLEKAGHKVKRLNMYHTRAIKYAKDELKKVLEQGLDFITFTSNSSIDAFFKTNEANEYLSGNEVFIGIGPATFGALQNQKLKSVYMAKPHTMDGIIDQIKELTIQQI